jgi:CDP-4-dehydro-6-deoxyglucose reductase
MPLPAAQSFAAELVAARPLSPLVRELVFEREGGTPLDYSPGQWVNLVLSLPDGEVKKAYSIASAPKGSGRFELAVTRVEGGAASEHLHAMPVGSSLRVVGPHGLFTRDPADAKPALFVATGTGLSPLRSMMQAALLAGSTAPLWLLYGCRFESDLLYADEARAWAEQHPGVRYETTLSRPPEGWTGRKGYVQDHVPELYRALAEQAGEAPHVYTCGLDRMVSAVKDLVRGELGAERRSVHFERYD